jgi:signal transduction histidine kinase
LVLTSPSRITSLPFWGVFLLWSFLGLQSPLTAQSGSSDSRFIWLRADDGLPSSQISCLLEDAQGYLWLGTAAGLSRYDGQHVSSFGIRDGLPHIRIQELAEDDQGRVWALSDGLLTYLENGRFQQAPLSAEEGLVFSLGADSEGHILVGTANNLLRFIEGTFRPVFPPTGGSWDHPRPLFNTDGDCWIYDQMQGKGALIRLDGNKSESHHLDYQISQPEHFLAIKDRRGRILFSSDAGMVLLDPGSNRQQVLYQPGIPPDPSKWHAALLDRNDRLWIAEGQSGISCWYWASALSQDSLWLMPLKSASPDRQVEAMLQDREGNIWFGTGEDGAAFLPGNASFVRNLNSNSGLADNVILSVAGEGNQNIWFGMRSGQVDVLNFAGIGGVGNPILGRAGNSPVTVLMEAPDGSMLAGSQDGLFRSLYRLLERYGPILDVRSLAKDLDGSIYVGTGERLYRFDQEAFKNLASMDQMEQIERNCIIADRPALRMVTRPEGGCWYANEEGLFRFDGFETSRPVVSEGLLAATISDLAIVAGCLAVSTRGDGLLLIPEDGLPWQIDALSGLPSNICSDLFAQNENTLWVATNRGIARLEIKNAEKRELEYETYDIKDGLISNEINAMVALRGSLYLGTNSGVSIFNESDFRSQSVPPGIYFLGISIADRDTLVLPEYDLSYSQNRVSIRFSGIAFNSGNLIQYRYRLKGLDEEWIATSSGEVRYASLSPGQYEFEVQAINKDGLLSESIASFSLHIRRPWYQAGWFLFLVGLSLAVIGYAFYSFLIGRADRKNLQRSVSVKTAELDRKIHELRRSNDELEQFAYIASHDLKEPLRNIANYVQLLQRRLNGQLDDDANQYMHFAVGGVKRMYDMIDGLLLYSGLTQPDPSVEPVDLNQLLEEVIAEVTMRSRERQVVVTKTSLPTLMVNRKQIRELLEQLFDNAIKFNNSEVARIQVALEDREEDVEISLRDNGLGLEEQYQDKVFQIFEKLDLSSEQTGSGIGLALCKKIVERHGGRIWFASSGQGSTFYFTLKKNLQNQTR